VLKYVVYIDNISVSELYNNWSKILNKFHFKRVIFHIFRSGLYGFTPLKFSAVTQTHKHYLLVSLCKYSNTLEVTNKPHQIFGTVVSDLGNS
jgi:hypothetical protein